MANTGLTTEYNMPQYGYLSFDPITMKNLIKERLTKSGIVTEQLIEGSYLSQLIDIFAFTYHTLIYYMNQTAAEGNFSDTELFENLNRITKALGYNPIGVQTAVVAFNAKFNENLVTNPKETHIVPRYSFIPFNGKQYTIANDIAFVPANKDEKGFLSNIDGSNILYEGVYKQYDIQIAEGTENEIFFLNPGESVNIDHFTIDVYVKHNGKWAKWDSTVSLYLNNANDYVYEIRLNEHNYYELKFGNDINGKRLAEGDQIAIYYIDAGQKTNEIGAHALDGYTLTRYSSDLYDEIMEDVRGDTTESVLSYSDIQHFKLYNKMASTDMVSKETIGSIKTNAPGMFRSQYRLVTDGDFENFVKTNYSNLIRDVKVGNNWDYISSYIKYMKTIGMTNPTANTEAVLNQVLFADACNFNNVYITAIPRISTSGSKRAFLSSALKSSILTDMKRVKVLTCEPIIVDPVYIAFGIGFPSNISLPTMDDIENGELHIVLKQTSKHDSNVIKAKVQAAITEFFSPDMNGLGQKINLLQLHTNILDIDGIESIYTCNKNDPTKRTNGFSFIKVNEVYPNDISIVMHDTELFDFQFPYLIDEDRLADKIIIDSDSSNYYQMEA